VKLADGQCVTSSSWVRVPVVFGDLTRSVLFHVLDTPIDMVFGM